MKWKGKVIGLLLGLLTRRPALMLLGFALGHLYDIGMFSQAQGSTPPVGPPPTAPPVLPDPYAVLGVSASVSDDDLEQAYRRRISEYHPDRVANAAQEIRDLAGQRALEINGAYEQIKRQRGL